MGKVSKIAWTDATFNPWHGCHKVSPGCQFCYAEAFTKRCGRDFGIYRFFGSKHWQEPIDWDKESAMEGTRRRVFSGSMCDVFESGTDLDPERARLFETIERTPSLDWMLLTKRPENVAAMLPPRWLRDPLRNVWLMTTVEYGKYGYRSEIICDVPAVVHGLSIEPMLGPVAFADIYDPELDWVIVGAESGPKRRPFNEDWVRSLRDACVANRVAFFYKQKIAEGGIKIETPELDGQRWVQFPTRRF